MDGPLRLLLIDDVPAAVDSLDQALRSFFLNKLNHFDFEIVKACDGIVAEQLLKKEGPFHLIVTDLELPGVHGKRIITRLKQGAYESASGTPASAIVFVRTAYPRHAISDVPFDVYATEMSEAQLLGWVGFHLGLARRPLS